MIKCDFFLQHIAGQLAGHTRVLVGFSGGLDSSVLLHLLASLRDSKHPELQVRAIHIHHGLNSLAENWAKHCQRQCEQWQIPLEIARVQVNPRKNGLEAAARIARYQAFATHLAADEVLLTAQHQDDQCETLLLALKRGSGPAGLSSMAPSLAFAQSHLLRPLLTYSRQDIKFYAQQHQMQWIEDDSNQDDRFDRNFLRLRILPLLNQRWPHFAQAAARSAGLCAEQERLVDELLAETLHQLQNADGSFSLDKLTAMSEVKRNALLRRWLAGHGVTMPSRDQLQRLWQEVALARQDADPCLQLGQYQVRRFRQHLYLLPPRLKIEERVLIWPVGQTLVLPANLGRLTLTSTCGQHVRSVTAGETVSVRFGLRGEIKIVGRDHSRQSKKLWQELNIPPWERNRIPLLYFNDQLIAAAGVFITQEGQAKESEPGAYLNWLKTEKLSNN